MKKLIVMLVIGLCFEHVGVVMAQTKVNSSVNVKGFSVDGKSYEAGAECNKIATMLSKKIEHALQKNYGAYKFVSGRTAEKYQLLFNYDCIEAEFQKREILMFRVNIFLSAHNVSRLFALHRQHHYYYVGKVPFLTLAPLFRASRLVVRELSKKVAWDDFQGIGRRAVRLFTRIIPALNSSQTSQGLGTTKTTPPHTSEELTTENFFGHLHLSARIGFAFAGDMVNIRRRSFFADGEVAAGASWLKLSLSFGAGSSDVLGRVHTYVSPQLEFMAAHQIFDFRTDIWIGAGYMLMRRGHYTAHAAETERHLFLVSSSIFVRLGNQFGGFSHGLYLKAQVGIGQVTANKYYREVSGMILFSVGYQILFWK